MQLEMLNVEKYKHISYEDVANSGKGFGGKALWFQKFEKFHIQVPICNKKPQRNLSREGWRTWGQ